MKKIVNIFISSFCIIIHLFPMTRLYRPRHSQRTVSSSSKTAASSLLWGRVRAYTKAMKEKKQEKMEKIKVLLDQTKKLTTQQLEKLSHEIGKKEEKSDIPLEERIKELYEILLEGLTAEDIEEVQELVRRRLFESHAQQNFSTLKALFGYKPDLSEQAYMEWIKKHHCKGNEDCYKDWLKIYKRQKMREEKERKEREIKE